MSHSETRVALSGTLAELQLAGRRPAEVLEIVAREAQRLLGARSAVVVPVDRSVDVITSAAREVAAGLDDDEIMALVSAARRQGADEDAPDGRVRVDVVEDGSGDVVSVALVAGGATQAVMLLGFAGNGGAAKDAIASFARQASAVVANALTVGLLERRQDRLTALYETARELSQQLDLETLLASIVERARPLLGAPISYIMLVDEAAAEIYTRVAVGTSSRSFSQIRLPIGMGLGGSVADRRQHQESSDYLNDPGFIHHGPVDEAVREEGVRSVLGVPLVTSDTLVGVLYVADRAVRSFEEGDIALLMSLADHAAVALANASLYEQTSAALAEVERANEVISAQFRLLQRAQALNGELSAALLAGQSLQQVVELMSAFIGERVMVVDDAERVVASAGEPADRFGQQMRDRGVTTAVAGLREATSTRTAMARSETAVIPADGKTRLRARLVVPIVSRSTVMGSLWVEVAPAALDEQRLLVEQGARVVALDRLMERALSETERRLGSEFLSELLSSRLSPGEVLARRAAELGIDLAQPHQLLVIRKELTGRGPQGAAGSVREELVTRLARKQWCLLADEWSGRVIAVVEPLGEATRTALSELVADAQRTGLSVRVAVSRVCHAPADYRREFSACDRVLRVLGDEWGASIVDLDEAHVLGLLFGQGGDDDVLSEFVRLRLGALIEADKEQGGELVRTLEVYLNADGSPSQTAATLHVHVNTVYYRLNKIRQLLGEHMFAPTRSLDLRVALLARRLGDASAPAPDG